ncbi:minor capsid protein [Amycolatopsis taiwanensis]|uniref:minor capsid protein n=1 Tax=Amycolatopsis taiwanensis TaxID=342230 RepID=UPI00048840F1|nr:minor capsid protein [Amycolatopsis taiwanensis]
MTDSYTVALLKGLAQRIADQGIALYRSDGSAYLPTEIGLFFDAMPPEPDRAIVLTDYPVTDDPSLSDSVLGVQMRSRGLPYDAGSVKAIADGLFDLFHGARDFTVNGIRVVYVVRNSGAVLGRDDNNRWERSDNYYFSLHRPSANRT